MVLSIMAWYSCCLWLQLNVPHTRWYFDGLSLSSSIARLGLSFALFEWIDCFRRWSVTYWLAGVNKDISHMVALGVCSCMVFTVPWHLKSARQDTSLIDIFNSKYYTMFVVPVTILCSHLYQALR